MSEAGTKTAESFVTNKTRSTIPHPRRGLGDAVVMATKRISKYDKAMNRLARVGADVLCTPDRTRAQEDRWSQAVRDVLEAHWEDHPDEDCEWCARYPSLFQ